MTFTCNLTGSFIEACKTNDLISLQELVQIHGTDFIDKIEDGLLGDNLLHLAQSAQSTQVVEFLAHSTPQLITRGNKIGLTPFHVAIDEENEEYCYFYMQSAKANLPCVDLNAKDISSRTLLHYAANKGHLVLTQVLLALGANALCYDNLNYTPFDLACSFYPKIAALLNPTVAPTLFSRCAIGLFMRDPQWFCHSVLPIEVIAKSNHVFNAHNQHIADYLKTQNEKELAYKKRR